MELQSIKGRISEVPWLLCGDFNTKLDMFDRSDYYDGMTCTQNALDFRNFLDAIELTDLPCSGPSLTWSSKRSTRFLAKKLDRFLVNENWMDEFDGFRASFLPPDFSDH